MHLPKLLLVSAGLTQATFSRFQDTGGALTVEIDSATGAFKVVDGASQTVLTSSDVSVTVSGKVFSHKDATLKVAHAVPLNGSDPAGEYSGMNFTWATSTSPPTTFETHIKLYAPTTSSGQSVVFAQYFPLEIQTGCDKGYDDLSTAFPTLQMAAAGGRGVVSFQGDMTGDGTKVGQWVPGKAADQGNCRVTTGFYKLHASSAGYDAYVPKTMKTLSDGREYAESETTFCDCTGKGSCEHWAFQQDGLTVSECEAECDSQNCSCFDFKPGSDGAPIGQGVSGTGPVVLFQDSLTNTMVLSPHSNFMAASQTFVNNTLSYGIMSGVQTIPAGFTLETVLVLDEAGGVNSAMDKWGNVLLARSGKQRYAYQRDPVVQLLGYSTDNGAYYYYQTEPNKTYEATLLDVKAYADKADIPYQYVLLDSWWYYKGQGGGVATWDARPDVFPNGLPKFYEKTGWVGQLHNRYWSTNTPYAKQNGGQYNFVLDNSSVCVPDDQTFWNDLIANKTQNGQNMICYEQDWLDVEFDKSKWLKENATAATTWMTQMNDGCANSNVTIQMCMSHVRHILQSTEMPAVTNARASGDYHPGSGQWDIGVTSVLAHAVGIAPSKDNYWSTPVQNGTHYGNTTAEPRSWLQSAVLTFSNGPVCPSDAVGMSNASLIKRACDSTGRLLSPDRPAAAIDAVFVHQAGYQDPSSGVTKGVDGKLWWTYANVSGDRYGYLLVPELNTVPFSLSLGELGYEDNAVLVARILRSQSTATVRVDDTHPLSLSTAASPDDPELVVLSPVLSGGWALLGEWQDKWVSVSPQRFSTVTATADKIALKVTGGKSEDIHIAILNPREKVISVDCELSATGEASIELHASDAKATCA